MANMYKAYGPARVFPSTYYQRAIRMAVIIVCQQAARNYFLRVGGADGTKPKEMRDGQ